MGGNGEIESAAGAPAPIPRCPTPPATTRSYDPTCGCRKPGQSWASALADAETWLDRRKGDMIVSAAKAEELSKPRETRETRRAQERAAEQRKKLEAQQAAATSAEARVNVVIANPEAAALIAATEGKESAGIGPQNIPTTGTVSTSQGKTMTVTTADGEQRKVRLVAPALTITPQAGDNRPDGPVTVRR